MLILRDLLRFANPQFYLSTCNATRAGVSKLDDDGVGVLLLEQRVSNLFWMTFSILHILYRFSTHSFQAVSMHMSESTTVENDGMLILGFQFTTLVIYDLRNHDRRLKVVQPCIFSAKVRLYS